MKIKIHFDAALSMLSPDCSLVELEAAISNRDVYRESGIVFYNSIYRDKHTWFRTLRKRILNTLHILINQLFTWGMKSNLSYGGKIWERILKSLGKHTRHLNNIFHGGDSPVQILESLWLTFQNINFLNGPWIIKFSSFCKTNITNVKYAEDISFQTNLNDPVQYLR